MKILFRRLNEDIELKIANMLSPKDARNLFLSNSAYQENLPIAAVNYFSSELKNINISMQKITHASGLRRLCANYISICNDFDTYFRGLYGRIEKSEDEINSLSQEFKAIVALMFFLGFGFLDVMDQLDMDISQFAVIIAVSSGIRHALAKVEVYGEFFQMNDCMRATKIFDECIDPEILTLLTPLFF